MNGRLLVVFLLGFSSGLPLALITSTLQAWYATEGMSILATGTLSLLGLPYLYRVFWGPLLDRFTLFSLGKRRSWMLAMQVCLLLGFNLLAWFSPDTHPQTMAFLAFFLACCSATQDVAIDAQRVEYLSIRTQGLGAALAVLGYRVALLVAGGFALILAHYVGFSATYRIVGGLMIMGIVTTLLSAEPSHVEVPPCSLRQAFILPFMDLWRRKDCLVLMGFILFYSLGDAFTATTSGIIMPFLVGGIGFSLDTIGYVNKVLGISAIVSGGLIAGVLLTRWSLYRALLFFGLFQAVTNLLFVALALIGKNTYWLASAVLFDNLAAGMGSTALVALFMRLVNRQYTASQFSMLVVISTLPRVVSGPLGAFLYMHLGWVGLYQLSFLFALCFLPFLQKLARQDECMVEFFGKHAVLVEKTQKTVI